MFLPRQRVADAIVQTPAGSSQAQTPAGRPRPNPCRLVRQVDEFGRLRCGIPPFPADPRAFIPRVKEFAGLRRIAWQPSDPHGFIPRVKRSARLWERLPDVSFPNCFTCRASRQGSGPWRGRTQ